VPADLQLGIHGIGDVFMQCWDTYRRNVLRELVYRLLNLEQGRE
jgi:hypothetical protein